MKIDVLFSVAAVPENYFNDKNCIVIDLLRASSTIITALNNGAKEIIPVNSVEEALKISKNLDKSSYLLCGERQTQTIEGFDLGNSPLEFTEEKVKGKRIIFSTTNGTKVFNHLKNAKKVLLAATSNVSTVALEMVKSREDWVIICAARDGFFDASDALCAGILISKIHQQIKETLSLNDAARLSLMYFENSPKKIEKVLRETDHGKFLVENNFENDIKFISQIDIYYNKARFKNNLITLLN
ncbi:MAG: 2-phosphosulfolactate phosphatase [Bacteroidetes bacterium]|nr:2-phosphosulfolactate phosphatase [Bacteroidota bacterium]MBU2585942.1 2-phosphosulfolactate phosphatase [Bacteroidota bacterium]